VIATVERGEPAGLAMMEEMHIDPALVARRLLWAAFWSLDENLFFHADPHPANLLIGRDSTITFIDFGSCGSFDNEQRWAAERVAACMKSDDVEGMARATMKLMEPLPPVDLSAIVREAQAEFVRVLSTFRTKAKHTEWWERTSARLWLAIVKIARQRNVPLSIGTLRMMRATLLYDTLVLRLDRTADRYERYDRFRHDRAVFARKRWHARTRLGREQFFLRADEWLETADHLVDRAQHALSAPAVGFHAIVEKWVFAFAALNRLAWRGILLTLAATGAAAAAAFARAGTVDLLGAFLRGTSSPAYRVTLAVLAALLVRQIFVRSKDRDV
jgi:ubiquinone biosynthesis protein